MKYPPTQRWLASFALFLLLLAPDTGWAAASRSVRGEHSATQGPLYLVSAIRVEYAQAHPLHPPLAEIRETQLGFGNAGDGYVGARRGGRNIFVEISEIERHAPMQIYATGLRELNEQIVREFERRGLIGVFVSPHPEDIDPDTGEDRRERGQTELRIVVHTGRVAGLRAFARGPKSGAVEPVDAPAHRRIKESSPLQPVGAGQRDQGDLLSRTQLDDYLASASRYPGRRVDVSMTPARQHGGVFVDYLVAEERPWTLYSQWSNTGTEQTTESRQRFGFSHSQFTGHDDVLRFDYVTGDFDDVHAAFGSYEIGVPLSMRLRLKAGWSDYSASQYAFAGEKFEGTQWNAGAELVRNVYQRRKLFVDLVGGLRWMDIEVSNIASPKGEETFLVPSLALEVERYADTSALSASLGFEANLSSLAGTSSREDELFLLGRSQVDDDWRLLRWSGNYTFYLEPWFNGEAWRYGRTSSSSTLAHEIALRTRGQYAFDTRLIPQSEFVLGGFHSVRGYPQSTISADSGMLMSAEYRYHWPRSLRPEPPRDYPVIGAFRVAPQRVYGRPDWDLVLRGFFDWGYVTFSDSLVGEDDETLASLGIGIELILRRNLSLRLDYGIAQSAVRRVDSGNSETHVQATLRY